MASRLMESAAKIAAEGGPRKRVGRKGAKKATKKATKKTPANK